MSCEVKKIASFIDIEKCKSLLVKEKDGSVDNQVGSINWLHDCQTALSPTGEILVIAKGNQLVLFTSKWDSTEIGDVKMKYSISWHGNPCHQSGEEITAILCLPLIPQGQSINGGADWTCIVVGFSTGAIRFYTEAMNQLISETLHDEPITRIKCNSYKTPKQYSSAANQESNEIVYVLYKSVICTINGFSLFQTLRGCRNQLARQRASFLGDALHTSIPIDFKKYSFPDQDAITDACFVGQTSINTFDHLVTASLVGGFHSNYRPSPPQTSLIVATGRKPFVGFHYTLEGAGNPMLTDVALAVASKIKNSVATAIPGWFGFGSKKPTQQEKLKETAQEPAEQLGCRFGLCDLWRHGDSIAMSPDGRLSAVSDSLGRVMLVDNANGVARRLWKGYREAQCGFLEVEEDVQKTRHRKGKQANANAPPRHALFIIIYAPRKGLIEIFATQQGPRVASFKVTKHGRLLYVPHGLVGFSSPPVKGVNASQFPVIFISDEGLAEMVVPFHCALSDDTSKKARDLHVLKKIKTFLKQEEYSNTKLVEEMEKFARELKTDEIRLQTIEMMMSNKHITTEAFKAVLNVFMEDLQNRENLDTFGKNLQIMAEELDKLLSFYQFVQDLNNLPPNYKTVVNPSEVDPSLPELLILPAKEVDLILNFIKHIKSIEGNKKREIRVGFQEKETRDLIQFLSCFDFDSYVNAVQKANDGNDSSSERITLSLKSEVSEEKLRSLGESFFKGMFYSDEWISDWQSHAKDCCLDEKVLMKCLLSFWLSKNQTENVSGDLVSMVELMKAICSLVDPSTIALEYNTISPWWENIQKYISGSRFVLPALLAAVCCRALTIITEQEKELQRSQSGEKKNMPDSNRDENSSEGTSNDVPGEWENVSKDTWQWDILITQLEDIALLNTILNLSFYTEKKNFTKLPFDYELESLNSVLSKGNGRISELVAKWLVKFGLEPSVLIDSADVEFQAVKIANDKKLKRLSFGAREGISPDLEEAKEVKVEAEGVSVILNHLATLKSRFPYSLTSSALLCNMSWEFMAYWFRNVDDLDSLHSAIEFLKAIPSVRLKYGISYLSWITYLQQKFEGVSKLLNKIGKVPKEKLCVQELNLTHLQVPIFLKLITEFLNVMLESSFNKESDLLVNHEGIWENKLTATTPSLVSLALSQPMVNDDLLLLHYQLSVTLYIISALNIRLPKIFNSLFDSVARSELFTDLTKSSQMSSHYYNQSLKLAREQFLCKAVTGAVQTIELVEIIPPSSIAESPDYVPETKLSVDEATKWLRICFDLARMWDVPLDNLRRHHICELYSCGFDRLAEEIIPAVNECSMLASQLLVVAGQRLKVYVHSSSNLSEKLSNLSPVLTTWFDGLDSENLKSHNIILNDISVILAYVLKWLPEGHDDLKLAVAMADSIPSLDNNNEL